VGEEKPMPQNKQKKRYKPPTKESGKQALPTCRRIWRELVPTKNITAGGYVDIFFPLLSIA
jgi:hypothetical protein